MDDVYIGKGKLHGKGVYASRDFNPGEIVKYYNLKKLTQEEFNKLPQKEKRFVHSFWAEMYLFPEPSRYTNHSAKPNTESDFERMCDIATRHIKKGEMITTNATREIERELETFVEVYEKGKKVKNFVWLRGGYRNALVSYEVEDKKIELSLKRMDGNWRVVSK